MPLDGCRIFPVARLLEAIEKKFSEQSIRIGYSTQTCLFEGAEIFAQMVTRLANYEGEAGRELQYFLSGDVIALRIMCI